MMNFILFQVSISLVCTFITAYDEARKTRSGDYTFETAACLASFTIGMIPVLSLTFLWNDCLKDKLGFKGILVTLDNFFTRIIRKTK